MKAFVCDVCEKREEPQRYPELPPQGWFTLYVDVCQQQHICSLTCLQDRVQQLTEAALRVAGAATPPPADVQPGEYA